MQIVELPDLIVAAQSQVPYEGVGDDEVEGHEQTGRKIENEERSPRI